MDPNRKETLEVYEHNAEIMFKVGFALCPLSWLMCWVYCSRRKAESERLQSLADRSFIFFWIAIYIIGIWTACYSAWWPSMTSIGYNIPVGEPE